jgi:hypothetical protein
VNLRDFCCSINDFDKKTKENRSFGLDGRVGVYVWRIGKQPIRVGKFETRAKRPWDHVLKGKGYTQKLMNPIEKYLILDLYLLSEKSNGKRYAVSALEMFLESELKPLIRSGLKGKRKEKMIQDAREWLKTICQ